MACLPVYQTTGLDITRAKLSGQLHCVKRAGQENPLQQSDTSRASEDKKLNIGLANDRQDDPFGKILILRASAFHIGTYRSFIQIRYHTEILFKWAFRKTLGREALFHSYFGEI